MAKNNSYETQPEEQVVYMDAPSPQQYPPQHAPMGFGMPSLQDPTIAHMRWVPDELTQMIYKRLAAVDIIVSNGQAIYQRIENVNPKLNQEGIEFVIATIEGIINQFVGLSNISDEEANELIAQYLYSFAGDLVYNQDRFDLNTGDMRLVMNVVKGLVFTQVKRAVKGHESKAFHTQLNEQTVQQNYTQGQQNSGFSLNPFRRKNNG